MFSSKQTRRQSYIDRQVGTLSHSLLQQLFGDQSSTFSWSPQLRYRPPLQRKASCQRMESSPQATVADMGLVWQCRRRSLHPQRKHTVLLSYRPYCTTRNRCSGSSMASDSSVCIPTSGVDFAQSQKGSTRGCLYMTLLAPCWPAKVWYAEIVSLKVGEPWGLPALKDLLPQAGREIVHHCPKLSYTY